LQGNALAIVKIVVIPLADKRPASLGNSKVAKNA